MIAVFHPLRIRSSAPSERIAFLKAERRRSGCRDLSFLHTLRPVIHQQRLRMILRQIQELPLPPSAKILELGCGASSVAVTLAERGYSVEAVDPAHSLLECTRGASAPEHGISRGRLWDEERLPFPDSTFDLVMAIGVRPRFESLENPVREWARVLKPGGFTAVNTATCADSRVGGAISDPLSWLGAIGSLLLRAFGLGLQPAVTGLGGLSVMDRAIAAAGMEKISAESEPQYLIIARKTGLCPPIPLPA